VKRWFLGAVAGCLLTLLASACGGGSPKAGVAHLGTDPTTTVSQPPAGTAPSAGAPGKHFKEALAFSECMRSHGLPDFPDPSSSGGIQLQAGRGSDLDPRSAKFQAAQKACKKYAPDGGNPPSAAQQAQAMARALAFSECMRTHGVPNFPDPQKGANGGIFIGGQGNGFNPSSPQFQSAQSACQSIMGGSGKGKLQEAR
jgi:hypothetical protein